jgi:CBS domain-containing protein
MDTALELLRGKPTAVVTATPGMTVLEAAELMNRHGIGSVLVLDGHRLAGIFTERDVLRRVVACGLPPERTRVGEVMTTDVLCCTADMAIDDVAELMRSRRVRHLPVVDVAGDVIGIVSIGDVNAQRFATCEVALHQVQDYVLRRA